MSNEDNSASLPMRSSYARHMSFVAPFGWLRSGIQDTLRTPLISLSYGLAVFTVSVSIVFGLFHLGYDHVLLPVLAAFLVIGPAIAVGLYENSRRLASDRHASLRKTISVKAASTGQILFVGVILMLLILLWLRAAYLLYALFFGMEPFSGFDQILSTVFLTPRGWGLLTVGSMVGGLFAAFGFAISAFSIPMLLNERMDAFTAMAISMAMSWANKTTVIVWGGIVVILFVLSLFSALTGLIAIFPVLGHATWHAYVAIRRPPSEISAVAEPPMIRT